MRYPIHAAVAALALASTVPVQASEQLMERSGCISCHRVDQKLIGPAFVEIAVRYRGNSAAAAYLAGQIRNGGEGVWGDVPMPPTDIGKLSDADLTQIVEWILTL